MKIKIGKFRIDLFQEIKPSVASVIACVVSYIENESVLWAVLHYFLGFIYVVYWMIKKIFFLIF